VEGGGAVGLRSVYIGVAEYESADGFRIVVGGGVGYFGERRGGEGCGD
jgi:hypothetical protein